MGSRPLRLILSQQSAFVATVPFLFVAFLGIIWLRPQIRSDVESHQLEIARAVEVQLESYLSSSLNEVRAIASLPLEAPKFKNSIQQIIDDQLAASVSLKLLYAVGSNGRVKSVSISRKHSDMEHRELEGIDLSVNPLYREALQNKRPAWSDSFLSIIGSGPSVAVAVPGNGLVTMGEIDLAKLTGFLHRIALNQGQQIFIIDRRGQIIADGGGEYTGKQRNISNIPIVSAGLDSPLPVSSRFRFNNQEMIGSIIECPTVKWDVMVFQPVKAAYRSALTTGGIIFAGLLASLLLGICAALVMARKLSHKFEALAFNARSIARNRPVTGWPKGNIAEIGQLAGDLQAMADEIDRRERQLGINAIQFEYLYALSLMGEHEEEPILDFALEASVQITASKIGYIYFVNDDETELTLHAWSRNVMSECTIQEKQTVYKVVDTGLWGEAIRRRSPVITNDYSSPNPLKKGYPEGHVPITRHLNIPLIDNGKIVIVAGIGNKETDYDESDVQRLTILMGATWRIIQEKRARKAMRESEERYRQLVAHSPDAILVQCEGSFVFVNPAGVRLLGATGPEEIIGRPAMDFIHPDFRQTVRERMAQLDEQNGSAPFLEEVYVRLDGSLVDVEVSATSFIYNGRPAAQVIARDISSRKRFETALLESEELFHQLFVQNDDAIILLNRNSMMVMDANPAALEMFGVGHEKLQHVAVGEFINNRDFRSFMRAIRSNELPGFLLQRVDGFRADGESIIIAIKGKIIRLKSEEVILCSIRNITEKIRLEEEIKASQAKLIQANKMTSLGMLVSSVAHEINNPNHCIAINTSVLTNIWQDAAPILEDSCTGEDSPKLGALPFEEIRELVPQLFSGISDSSKRISSIVANLRNFVKKGRRDQDGEFDVNRSIGAATAMLWHNIRKLTDNFRQELADDLPLARGNAQQMEQVFINLIMNALQSLPDKSHGVVVTTSFEKSSKKIVIRICDQGKGMDRRTLQRLSEPFFTTREDEGGTGLGLYISTSIVSDYDGSLSFASEPGKGTIATIDLPVSCTVAAPRLQSAAAALPGPQTRA